MAHDGVAYGRTVWRREGYHVQAEELTDLTAKEQIRFVLAEAELDWTVDRYDVFDETGKRLSGWAAFKRSDNDHLMGVFRESYTVLQNHEVFELVAPLLNARVLEFDTVGEVRDGEDVWGLFRVQLRDPSARDYFAERQIDPCMLITINHSYLRPVTLTETPICAACKTTLSAPAGAFDRRRGRWPSAIQIKHTKRVKATVESVNLLWGQITARYTRIEEAYELLRHRFLSDAEFDSAVLGSLAPLPKDPESKQYEPTVRRMTARRELVRSLWEGEGCELTGNRSAWEAYLACVEAVDHFEDAFPVRKDRLAALFPGGSLASKKQDVLNKLYALATG